MSRSWSLEHLQEDVELQLSRRSTVSREGAEAKIRAKASYYARLWPHVRRHVMARLSEAGQIKVPVKFAKFDVRRLFGKECVRRAVCVVRCVVSFSVVSVWAPTHTHRGQNDPRCPLSIACACAPVASSRLRSLVRASSLCRPTSCSLCALYPFRITLDLS